jgi:hypothetical protein
VACASCPCVPIGCQSRRAAPPLLRLAPVPTGSEKELVSGPVVPSTESMGRMPMPRPTLSKNMARGSRASAVNQSAADYHPYFSAPGFRNSVVDVAWASSPCRSGTTPKSLEGHVAATARAISERASERAWNGLPRVPRQRHGLDVHAGTRARSARSVFPKRCAAKYPLHERRKSFLE